MALTRTFTAALRAVLSPTQNGALVPAEIRDVHQLDLYSPTLLLVSLPGLPVAGGSTEELAAALRERATGTRALSEDDPQAAAGLFEGWAADVRPALTPVPVAEVDRLRVGDALAAGRVQLRAMEELARRTADAALRGRLRASKPLFVPRLVAAADDGR